MTRLKLTSCVQVGAKLVSAVRMILGLQMPAAAEQNRNSASLVAEHDEQHVPGLEAAQPKTSGPAQAYINAASHAKQATMMQPIARQKRILASGDDVEGDFADVDLFEEVTDPDTRKTKRKKQQGSGASNSHVPVQSSKARQTIKQKQIVSV